MQTKDVAESVVTVIVVFWAVALYLLAKQFPGLP